MIITHSFKKPFYIEKLQPLLNSTAIVLEVGCGNHAPTKFKRYFPNIKYFGLDKDLAYNLDDKDLSLIDKFFKINLDDLYELKQLPDDYFDCIVMAHVLEHLKYQDDVVKVLITKLKRGGMLFLEYPGSRSLTLPSMKISSIFQGSLNFYDDSTHITVPDTLKILSIIKSTKCRILSYGVRRSWKRIFFLPGYFINSIISFGKIDGAVFWDILGFADYIISIRE